MPAVDLAQRIELDQTGRMRGRGKVVAAGSLVLHQTLQRMHQTSPQRLAAEERPIVEFRTILRREACEEISPINLTGLVKVTAIAGALEQMCIDLQRDCRRPS